MKPEVFVYDTTLRDGSQGEGISFSVNDKLRLADQLDAFGIHYIEGGWPGSNPKDIEFFSQARRRRFRRARLAAFGATRRKHQPVERDDQVRLLLEAETPVVTVFGKTWLLHVKEVLGTTPDENLGMVADTIRYLKDHGREVVYDGEHAFDGYKDDAEYAMATWQAAEKAGADTIVLCDTNGGCLPSEVRRIVEAVRGRLAAPLGIHTHNDAGLAVANALAAVEAGAAQVQGTINGYGERTGNCNLTTVIPNLAFKMGKRILSEAQLRRLRDLSQFVDEIANMRHDPRQPWVGATAFAHKGGMHVNAVQKLARTFEHIDPAVVGNRRRVLVSDLAGRSNIVMKARELGFPITHETPELKTVLNRVKELEYQGYEFEAAEGSLILLIRKCLAQVEPRFRVETYHVSMRGGGESSVCEATIKVRVGDRQAHTVADGDGPVNALDQALRSALASFYPVLKKVRLTDYKVRILDSTSGTAALTRVLIESSDGRRQWGTVGVSGNIIEASLQALTDSLEYCLMKGR
ncbi:MAG TPA: citramalate synthase [Candidatus Paceibacterota bacterium]|nr:citramalate synthase [Verrucomicrobiota bacterium]HRZ46017.1 citramalate synthase [Candidatus Paceibacterota bacterium]HRZ93456.1 citramalate synthase [Candidatus Paceibacterota bacterium]